jgi:hypothetical protein
MVRKPFNAWLAFLTMVLLAGCVVGPAISKKEMGNLEVNVFVPNEVDARATRIYVDGFYVGNVSERRPVLFLKRGKRNVRVELPGTAGFQDSIEILGDPNHQVLNVVLQAK